MDIPAQDLKAFKQDMLQALDDKFRTNNEILIQELRASEVRVENKVLTGVAEMLEGQLLPQIDDLDRRVTKLENQAAAA